VIGGGFHLPVRASDFGKAVILTNGTAGTVEQVWLDELHGLLISIKATMESGLSQP
jgi:hypothetical protein